MTDIEKVHNVAHMTAPERLRALVHLKPSLVASVLRQFPRSSVEARAALGHPDISAQHAALDRMRDDDPIWEEIASTPNHALRWRALGKMPKDSPAVVAACHAKDKDVRLYACMQLSRTHPERARLARQDPHLEIQREALAGLTKDHPALAEAWPTADRDTRRAIMRSVSGDWSLLDAALRDVDPEVQAAARRVLKPGDPRVQARMLAEQASRTPNLSDFLFRSGAVRWAVVWEDSASSLDEDDACHAYVFADGSVLVATESDAVDCYASVSAATADGYTLTVELGLAAEPPPPAVPFVRPPMDPWGFVQDLSQPADYARGASGGIYRMPTGWTPTPAGWMADARRKGVSEQAIGHIFAKLPPSWRGANKDELLVKLQPLLQCSNGPIATVLREWECVPLKLEHIDGSPWYGTDREILGFRIHTGDMLVLRLDSSPSVAFMTAAELATLGLIVVGDFVPPTKDEQKREKVFRSYQASLIAAARDGAREPVQQTLRQDLDSCLAAMAVEYRRPRFPGEGPEDRWDEF